MPDQLSQTPPLTNPKQNYSSLTDEDLVEKIKAKPEEKIKIALLDEILRRHQNSIYNYIYRCFPEVRGQADDIVQDTFIQGCLLGIDAFDPNKAKFIQWLYGISINFVKRYSINKHTKNQVSLSEESSTDSNIVDIHKKRKIEDTLQSKTNKTDENIDLQKAIDSLDERSREVIILRHQENLPYDEISKILNISVGNCRVIEHRALVKIKDFLGNK